MTIVDAIPKTEIIKTCNDFAQVFIDQLYMAGDYDEVKLLVERGSSAVECRTRNQVSPGSNPPLLPFRRLGIFVLSIDAPVDSAV